VTISSIASRSVVPQKSEGSRDLAALASLPAGYEALPVTSAGSDHATREESTTTKNPSPAQITQAVKQINDNFTQKGQNLYASIEKDKETGINVVKLLDKNTKEIVRQYPSKEIIAIAASIVHYQESKGQLLNISA
jgi:flagellar protein FlaG